MSSKQVVAAQLAFAPGQAPVAGKLEIANVRNTYGVLGPTRADSKLIPGDLLFVSYPECAGVGVSLNNNGRSLLAALAGWMREADEDDITTLHGFSGRSSYSSQSSRLIRSQASA